MKSNRSLVWVVVFIVTVVAACGANHDLEVGQQVKLFDAKSTVVDSQNETTEIESTHGTCGFTLNVAPETYIADEEAELYLELEETQNGITATITASTDSRLNALCASIDYDANAYTPVDIEWLAGFAQSDDHLSIEQLSITGTAHLGCVPVKGAKAETSSGVLARMFFKHGNSHDRQVSAVPTDAGIIRSERLNLLDKTLHWNYSLQGDYDQNGEVSYADLMVIAQHYLEKPTQETGDESSNYVYFRKDLIQHRLDYIRDGEINQADILGLVQTFGQRVIEWNVYTSSSTTEFTTIPFSDIDLAMANGAHYVANLPTLPDDVDVWVRPAADGSVGASSRALHYNSEGLSSIRLEYDEELMQYHGGVPENSSLSLWAKPGSDLLVQLDASVEPEIFQGDIYFDGDLLAPSPNTTTSERFLVDSNFGSCTLSVDKHRIQFSIPRVYITGNLITLTLPLLHEPEQRLVHQFGEKVLCCGPYIVDSNIDCPNIPFDADPIWDPLDHEFSWLYCGYGDATQDGSCSKSDDLAFITLYLTRNNLDIRSIEYLADFDHNTEVSSGDALSIAYFQNQSHDGYNMYYGPTGANDVSELTYSGHVNLSDGVGNRYIERLRFYFNYPEEVQPGDALYYCPTLGEAEGKLALLYTVPE